MVIWTNNDNNAVDIIIIIDVAVVRTIFAASLLSNTTLLRAFSDKVVPHQVGNHSKQTHHCDNIIVIPSDVMLLIKRLLRDDTGRRHPLF
jgi:hypothetical protein